MGKIFKRFLCLAISAIMLFGTVSGVITPRVLAATVYQLSELLSTGKIKPLGRTQAGGSGILADWSGAGFEINVSGTGGTMTVGYKSSYEVYWVIFIDGEQTQRIRTASASGGSSFSFTVPAGAHTVGVVKDTQISNSTSAYCDLTTLSFSGTIENAPAQKDLYIEFIGDSYSCGDGANAQYVPGVAWSNADHAATQGFPWYTAKALNADYSIIARGGIGLFVGMSEQEGTANKLGMQDIYAYTSGYRSSAGAYGFTRQADIVVVELGANDGINANDQYKTIEYWTEQLEAFTDQVRAKNPNAAIVFLSHNALKHKAMMSVVESRKASDPDLYAFFFAHNGNGSAALATQYDGHPSSDDHKQLANALVNYLRSADLIPAAENEPTYVDIPYYVSSTGSDSANGTSAATAKATLQAAVEQARADHASFADDARLVIYVSGTVSLGSDQQTIAQGALTTVNAKPLPILVTTYDYSGTKAVLDTGHAPADDASAAIVFGNNVTLKDITLQSTTGTAGYRDRYLYAGCNEVVLDNVTFAMTGDTPSNDSGWIVSAGIPSASSAPAETTVSSVTFKNGNYTNLAHVTTVQTNNASVASAANVECKIIIEDGAQMGTVYNRFGTTAVAAAVVDVRGGTVAQYYGTPSGTSSARITYSGDIVFTMSGGTVYGTSFATTGRYVTVNGNITTTISEGKIYITPASTDQYDAYLFGGSQNTRAQNIITTISGGTFYLVNNVASMDTGFYFGPSGGGTATNVTNTISGGSFLPMTGSAAATHTSIYMGPHTGTISGTLRNEISAGTFSFDAASAAGNVVFGSRGVNLYIGKIVNILGSQGSLQGPRFLRATTNLGGTWAQVGVTSKYTAEPAVSASTDAVAISNTIYGAYFGSTVYAGPTTVTNVEKGRYSFVLGSIKNTIYSGHFLGSFIAGGNVNVYGNISTDIHGGIFTHVYGDNLAGNIYNGVTLNIYGMTEYAPVKADNTWKIQLGVGTITTQSNDRDAVVLTLDGAAAPVRPTMPIVAYSGKISGTSRLVLKNATVDTLPTGFSKTDISLDNSDTLALLAADTLIAESVSGSGTLVLGSDACLSVTDSASGSILCSIDGTVTDDHVYIVAPASTAADTFTFPAESGVVLSNDAVKQWTTGDIEYTHVSISTSGGTVGYDTLEQALAAYTFEDGSYIKLWESLAETVTIDKPVYLDLNGFSASVILTGDGRIYGMDSSSDGCTEPTGRLTVSGAGVQNSTSIHSYGELYHYLALTDDDAYTFHRILLSTGKGIRPYNKDYGIGLFFRPHYTVDSSVADAINASHDDDLDYGVLLSINKADGSEPIYQRIGDLHDLVGNTNNSELRVLVYDLMPTNAQVNSLTAQDGTVCTNMTTEQFLAEYDLSAYTVTAQTYVRVGDTYLLDETGNSISLRDAIKQVDLLYPNYAKGSAEKTALDTMWKKYSKVIGSWFKGSDGLTNIGNIKIDISDWFK